MIDWPVKTLDALCDEGVVLLGRGNIISKKDIAENPGPYPIYSSARENEGKFGEYGAYMFNEEMITWSIDGGGRLFYRPKHKFSVTNVGGTLRVLKPEVLEIRYLYRALENLHSQKVFDWVFKAHPSVIRKVYDKIPIPPLDEQQRIVALLDAATERVTELTSCYEQARTHTNNIYISALADLFEKCTVDASAKQLSIGEICEIGDGNHSSKYPKSSEFVANGVPFIRANNISNGKVSAKGLRFISEKKHNELKKGHLRTGDVLITNRGEIGSLAIVGREFDGSNLNSQIAWLRVSDMVANRYLYYFLGSPNAKAQFFQGTTGAALQQLTISQLRKIRVPIVPLNTQKSLIEHLDKLKRKSSEMVSAYDVKLTAAKNLRQSILEAAFTGEL